MIDVIRGYASAGHLSCGSHSSGDWRQFSEEDADNSNISLTARRELVDMLLPYVTDGTDENEQLWAAYQVSRIAHLGGPTSGADVARNF